MIRLLMLCFVLLGARPAWAEPTRIVDGWYAHNATLIMLGAGDKIVGTVVSPQRFAWMYHVAPKLHQAQLFDSMILNGEAVLALKPDLVFVTMASNSEGALRQLGLNAVAVGFTDFSSLLTTIDRTASLLETPQAKDQAQRYRRAFLAVLRDRSASPSASKARVLHIASFQPLLVDGDHTIIDEWIREAGGSNAAQGLHGNKRPVSVEQIIRWAPDLIILGADAGTPDLLGDQTLWRQLTAVKRKAVFRNPAGVFNWDRYSPELLLQLIWAREILQTHQVDRRAILKAITSFYHDFYYFDLGPKEAERILDAELPF